MKNEAHFLESDVLQTYVKMIVPLQKKNQTFVFNTFVHQSNQLFISLWQFSFCNFFLYPPYLVKEYKHNSIERKELG